MDRFWESDFPTPRAGPKPLLEAHAASLLFMIWNQDRLFDIWQAKDSVTTTVEAYGYGVWDLRLSGRCLCLELSQHLSEEAAIGLSFQFALTADYWGEGGHGSVFRLYWPE